MQYSGRNLKDANIQGEIELFNLDSTIKHARMCVFQAAWQNVTRYKIAPCNKAQRGQAAAQKPYTPARSGVTHWVNRFKAIYASNHAVLQSS